MEEPLVDFSVTETKGTTILLADDHPLIRQALRNVLEKETDFEVIGEAGDGAEAVALAKELHPDVIVMDISMPGMNGLEATREIKAALPNIAILVLTVHSDNEHIIGILEAGAAGYLTKRVFGDEVIQAIRSVVAGEAVLSGEILQMLVKHSVRLKVKPVPLGAKDKLTVRQIEVLKMAARGMSNSDIAFTLELSLRTVKGYLVEVFSKLGVGSRTEAVISALRVGVLTLDDLE